VFKTTTFSLVLDGTGKVSSFTAADGTEHAASPPTAFMALVPEAAAEGGWVDVAAVRMVNESVLEASFTWTAANVAVADVAVQQQQGSAATATATAPAPATATAMVQIETVGAAGVHSHEYLQLTVLSFIPTAAVHQLRFASLALAMPTHGNTRCQNGFPLAPCDFLPGATSADSSFSAVVMPLSPLITAEVNRSEAHTQTITAASTNTLRELTPPLPVGLAGSTISAFLWAGPTAARGNALAGAELAFKHLQLPHPTIAGVRAKDSPAMLQGYILQESGDAAVAVKEAKASGLEYVSLMGFTKSDGSYAVDTTVFPTGELGLQHFVEELHAAGLKVGMHCMTACVSKNDPHVSPHPDAGLARDASSALAYSVDAAATFIPMDTAPTTSPWVKQTYSAWAASGMAVGSQAQDFDTRLAIIGSELVVYTSINASGLVGCTRGALGSTATHHTAGARVEHLAQVYGELLARPGTTLWDAVVNRVATLYDSAGFDMIYFDGAVLIVRACCMPEEMCSVGLHG
jgi:hypothetical protein